CIVIDKASSRQNVRDFGQALDLDNVCRFGQADAHPSLHSSNRRIATRATCHFPALHAAVALGRVVTSESQATMSAGRYGYLLAFGWCMTRSISGLPAARRAVSGARSLALQRCRAVSASVTLGAAPAVTRHC